MGFTTFSRRDAQRFRKVYPRIRKTPRFVTMSDAFMSVESDKVSFTNQSEGTYTFQLEYNEIPTVELTAELGTSAVVASSGDPDIGMVSVFITSLTTKTVTFETSAPFTGRIHIQVFKIGS